MIGALLALFTSALCGYNARVRFFVLARALVFCAVFAAGTGFAALPPPPSVESESYILIDADTGEVLGERNADLRLPPASLTKIMTAHLVFNALKDGALRMEQNVVISENAWAKNTVGSKTFIEVNDEVSVRDLLYGVIVQSGNDASIALAEALAGDEPTFAEWMNREARELELQNTNFENSTGLPGEKHYTSARDIAQMIRATINDHPRLYEIYAEPEFTYNNIRQVNRNALLPGARYEFAGADGVKTGYTKEAGYCLASSARRGEQRLIAVVMKTKSTQARARESAKLLNYGFRFFVNRRLFDENKARALPLFKGAKNTVLARPSRAGLMTLPREDAVQAVFEPRAPLIAPVNEGDVVGEIRVKESGGETLRAVPVLAAETVAEAGLFGKLADNVKLKFLGHGEERRLLAEW